MRIAQEETRQSVLVTTYYWILLLVGLVIVDDLTFGWLFWLLSLVNPWLSAAAALVIYWAIGFLLVHEGLKPKPHPKAQAFIARLLPERKRPEVERRQQQLTRKITRVGIAIPMALLFGGVFTALWLHKNYVIDRPTAKRLGFGLAGLYACEFALLHGLGFGGGLFRPIFFGIFS